MFPPVLFVKACRVGLYGCDLIQDGILLFISKEMCYFIKIAREKSWNSGIGKKQLMCIKKITNARQ